MNVKIIRRENLRALAKSAGGISKLALRLGKSQSQISHLIGTSPIKNIGDKVAAQIEAVFEKPSGWLDREHYSIGKSQAIYQTNQGQFSVLCRQVPLITWQEASIWDKLAYDYKPKCFDQMITTTAEVSSLAFALQVEGDVMESPYGISFSDGVVVIADPGEVAIHSSFVIATISYGKEATLRQVVSDGNKRYLKALNPRYPITEFTVNTTVYGVVKQMIVNFN